jgi:hypothetical protein
VDCPHRNYSETALTIFRKEACVNQLRKKHLILAFSIFLIAGCASTANRVMPGYGRMNVSSSALGVVLIRKNIQILNPQDVARDLGRGHPEDAYYGFFGAGFPAAIKACSRFARVSFVPDGDEMFGRSDGAVDYGTRVALPSRRRCISDSLQYLLIIDYLTVGHERKTNMPVGGGSDGNFAGFFSGSESLTHTADFVLWDNRAGTVAAYGSIRERIRIYDPLTKEVWLEMLKKTARSVVDGMPYRK